MLLIAVVVEVATTTNWKVRTSSVPSVQLQQKHTRSTFAFFVDIIIQAHLSHSAHLYPSYVDPWSKTDGRAAKAHVPKDLTMDFDDVWTDGYAPRIPHYFFPHR